MRPNKAKMEPGVGLQPDMTCDAAPGTAATEDADPCISMAASLVRRQGLVAAKPAR